MGGDALAIGRRGWPSIGFACFRFLVAICSPVPVIRPPAWIAALILLPTLGAREGIDLRGAKFVGLLVMVMNSDGPGGCLGIDKAFQIGRLPGSGCTQALAYCLYDFLLGVSHGRRQLWSPEF